jgi:hypothetical protein
MDWADLLALCCAIAAGWNFGGVVNERLAGEPWSRNALWGCIFTVAFFIVEALA